MSTLSYRKPRNCWPSWRVLGLLLVALIAFAATGFAQPLQLQKRTAHFAAVRAVAYDPLRQIVASGSEDQTIKLWSERSRQPIRTILAHTAAVTCLAFSPNGRTLASGSDDKTINLWDTRTGKRLRVLSGHTDRIESIAFNADGRSLASGSDDKTIRLWNVRTAKIIRTLSGHKAAVNAVAFSPDGQSIISGSSDQSVRVWSARAGKLLHQLRGHSSWVDAVAFSPDGRLVASGSWDKTVKLWDVHSGQLLQTLRDGAGWVNAVAFSRDGSLLAGGGDRTVTVWKIPGAKRLRTIKAHGDRVTALTFLSGPTLMTGSADKTASLWNAASGKVLWSFKGFSGRENAVTLAHLWDAQGTSDPATAIACYQRAAQLDEKVARYVIHLAEAYNQKARFAESQQLIERRIKVLWTPPDRQALHSTLADTHYAWAQSLVRRAAYAPAITHYRSAAHFNGHSQPGNIAANWYGLGVAYDALNRFDAAADSYQHALVGFRAAQDQASETVTLNSLGLDYQALSRFNQATNAYQQALKLSRANSDLAPEAATLTNLATTQHARGHYDDAIINLNRALKIKRELKDAGGEGIVLNNLGLVNQSLTNYEQAIGFYNQALAIHRRLKNQSEIATTLTNIGANYHYLGLYTKAITFYNQALVIQRRTANRREVANTLSNIGHAHFYLKQPQQAIAFYNQALSVKQALKDRAGAAVTLSNLALAYNALTRYEQATRYAQRTLEITRAIDDREGEGLAFNTLGLIDLSSRRYPASIDRFQRALPILQQVKARALEAKTLRNLMVAWRGAKKPNLAIFYGKQAVNLNQTMRAGIQHLDKDVQKGFLASKQDTYRELADVLIAQGRLPEAQQVLDMLKQEEYFNFVHRDGSATSNLNTRADLSKTEAEWEKRYKEISDKVAAIGAERGVLLTKESRTPAEDEKLAKLEADLTVAGQAFQNFLDRMAEEAGSSTATTDKVTQLRDAQGLMEDLREVGNGAVALYTVVGETKYRVVIITPDTQIAAEYPISAADLSAKVLQFRQVLQNPDIDPLPLAQDLYKILVAPIAKSLQDAHAETLMWCLDGVLRYLPMSALHDGKKYMVETYRSTVFTPCSQARLKDKPKSSWKALGLGVSKAQQGFNALPGVTEELHGIIVPAADAAATVAPVALDGGSPAVVTTTVADDAAPVDAAPTDAAAALPKGILPGQMKLDESFTKDSMKSSLRQRFLVVHIASHFHFRPGNESDSFLLLGDGSHLSLEEIKRLPNVFAGVELLTLSACDTATGGTGADGKEVEGFGVLAQRQGAKSVLASLWPVADESTKLLMPEFYRLRETENGILKVEALRRAQLLLLTGKVKGSESRQRRGSRLANENVAATIAGQQPFKADPTKPFAHPHFWAPFILIGNWL